MPRAFTEIERRQVRRQLLDAAAREVATVGYRRTTVAGLARAAGISKGAFYAFFDSKEALFAVLLEETEATLRSALRDVAGRSGSSEEVLGGVLELMRSAVAEHPLLRVLADPEDSAAFFRHLPPGALQAAREDDDRWFTALFEDLATQGHVLAADVPILVALPRLMFVLAQGREWLGSDFEPVTRLLVEALAQRLGRPS